MVNENNEVIQGLNKKVYHVLAALPEPTKEIKSRYRIQAPDGRVYSRFLGWHKVDSNLYGHQFREDEIAVVQGVLQEYGYEQLVVKKDVLGSLLIGALSGPFAHPKNTLQIFGITALYGGAILLAVHTGIFSWALDFVMQKYGTVDPS